MINILNHNTSYKHSKFSARPANAINVSTTYIEPFNISKRVQTQKQKAKYGLSATDKIFNTERLIAQKLNGKQHLIYQSKELLCWRFDLSFFNLQGFFLSMLKALHTCWNFAKNNKTIVFVSTEIPVHTGIGTATDMLMQKYPREFLPRIQIENKEDASRSSKDNLTPFHPWTSVKKVISKKKNSKHYSRKNNICKQNHHLPKKQRLQFFPCEELKNLINMSELFKMQQPMPSVETPHYAINASYRKLDGLLYKAASRRLCASFSRVRAPFFSNTIHTFQEKFTHLNSDFQNSDRNGASPCLKKLYSLELNKACLIKPGALTYSRDRNQKTWIKKFRADESDQITTSRTIATRDQAPKKFINKRRHHGPPLPRQQKPLPYDVIPAEIMTSESGIKSIQFQEKSRKSLNNCKAASSTPTTVNFSSRENVCINKPKELTRRTHSLTNRAKVVFHRVCWKKPLKFSRNLQWAKKYRSHDCYGMLTHAQAYNATKRFVSNPFLQHADLIFFVNPDKNPGLAEQIKKLGIPSVGIVSGLKSTNYRKQPHQSNLHDSVTYPIVGNPDNLVFVMMIVRVFTTLIQNVYRRKSTHYEAISVGYDRRKTHKKGISS